MDEQPSTHLLRILRDVASARGWNTAAMAKAAQLPRSEMKRVLTGQSALTVDTFVALATALELEATELTELASKIDSNIPDSPDLQPIGHTETADLPPVDPLGNQADQILRMGFSLGCDLILMLSCEQLADAGFPAAALEQYPENMPIRLDAAFHRHNDPRFLPEGLQLVLSFDALYTVLIPWSAIRQVALTPLHSGQSGDDSEPPSGKATHLRLVE